MKVAIVGAGLSGLACALELEKKGIKPEIFEKKDVVGDPLEYTIVSLKLFDRFYGSPMGHLRRKSDVKVKPLNRLREIVMIGENSNTTVKGNHGFIFYKGRDERSLENQLYKHLNTSITFNTYIDAEKLKDNYDYVIYAGGDTYLPKRLNILTETYNGHSRIATVLGKFDPNRLILWMNTEYSKQSFVYLVPYSKERANLILSVENITHRDLDYYWNKFLIIENIKYEVIDTRDVEHNLGLVSPIKYENMYMTGIAGGCMDSFLGFGFVNAIESGVMAARSIISGKDYNQMMKPIYDDIRLKHEYRKMMNTMDNKDYDRLIAFLGLPGIKQLIYRNPLYKASYPANLLKLYNDHTGKSS